MTRQMLDILGQPDSLARAADHQFGRGSGDLHRAAGLLGRAQRVVFTGMGSSLFAAIPAVRLLAELGIPAECVESSELLYYRRGTLRNGTVCVLVSRSGESIEITKLISEARARGAELVGITNVPDSTLAREVSHPILIGSSADQMVAIQTYTATLLVLMLLAIIVSDGSMQRRGVESLIAVMRSTIQKELERSDEWRTFLEAPAIYLLGRGPSMASVHEGALMLNESARVPSVAMSAAQFRHGPVEVVDSRFHAIVFASQSETADIDRTLAIDIGHMRGTARVCSAPTGIAPYDPIVEVVPVQIAATRLAEWRGITPGDFRYAAQVTKSEAGFRSV